MHRPFPTLRARLLAHLAAAAAASSLLGACSADGTGPSFLESFFTPDDPARFAYALNQGDGTISIYAVDAGTGRLRHHGYFAFPDAAVEPAAMALHHSREFLFTVDEATETLSVLRVDPESGTLALAGGTAGIGIGPHHLVAHPSADFVYVSAAGSRQVLGLRFDPEALTLTPTDAEPRTTIALEPTRLLMDPRGRYLVVLQLGGGIVQSFTIDSSSGSLDLGGNVSFGTVQIGGGVLDRKGEQLYISATDVDTIVRIEVAENGFLRAFEGVPSDLTPSVASRPRALALHPTGTFLYVLNSATQSLFYFSVSRNSGRLTAVGPLASTAGAVELGFEPTGRTGYLVDELAGTLARHAFDAESGALLFRELTRARVTPRSLAFVQSEDAPLVLPRQLYVTNRGAGDVTTFAVDPTSGMLTAAGPAVLAGAEPVDLALDLAATRAWVADAAGGALRRYAVAQDGALEELLPPLMLEGTPEAVAVEPSARFVYALTSGPAQVVGFALLEDGGLAPLGPPLPVGNAPVAAAVDPTGRFLFVANAGLAPGGIDGTISIFRIDPRSGALDAVIPDGSATGGPRELAFSSTAARLYAPIASGAAQPYDIIADTGDLGPVPPGTPVSSEPTAIALSPTGRYAYVAARGAGAAGRVLLYDVRESDGTLFDADDELLAARQEIAVGPGPTALAVAPREDFLYVALEESGTVAVLAIAADGTLSPVQEVPSGALPADLELTIRVE